MKYKVNNIHFVGIGGVGMCGIAEVLLNLGYTVTGSDMAGKKPVQRAPIQAIGGQAVHKGFPPRIFKLHGPGLWRTKQQRRNNQATQENRSQRGVFLLFGHGA